MPCQPDPYVVSPSSGPSKRHRGRPIKDAPLTTEWTLHDQVFHSLLWRFPKMQVDLFATRYNNRLHLFVSPFPDELTVESDGLSYDWNNRNLFACPPTLLVPARIKRLTLFICQMTLVAPLVWRRSWTTELVLRYLQRPLTLSTPPRPSVSTRFGVPASTSDRAQPTCLEAVRRCFTSRGF